MSPRAKKSADAPKVYRFKIKATCGGFAMDWNIPDVTEEAGKKLVDAIYDCIASKPAKVTP